MSQSGTPFQRPDQEYDALCSNEDLVGAKLVIKVERNARSYKIACRDTLPS